MSSISPDVVRTCKNIIRDRLVPLFVYLPFWAHIATNCKILISYSVQTAGIDPHNNIYFNPDFLRSLNSRQQLFLIAHELSHAAFMFFERKQNRDQKLFNVAQDYVINAILTDAFEHHTILSKSKFQPPGILYAREAIDYTAEEIYAMLCNEQQSMQSPGASSSSSSRSGSNSSWQNQMREVLRQIEQENLILDALHQALEDGVIIYNEELESSATGSDMEVAVRKAWITAKQAGTLPGSLRKHLDQLLEPFVEWDVQFEATISNSATRENKNRYAWNYSNRRQDSYGDIVMPTLRGHRCKAVVAVDTSGSMHMAMRRSHNADCTYLEQAMSEVEHLRKEYDLDIFLLNCDVQVNESEWVHPWEDLPSFTGGGGTNFVPVFEYIENHDLNPDILVFFTDGYGNYPEEAPPYDVIWVIFGEYHPPFGDVIKIPV
ncbi:MAG: hypothetical protein D6698_01540 [Gammaproteobacteria bacterium]|nr:MAG: hypothetical protein D6698_01540 [Gammaproteobacteria bacterium]